MNIQPSDACDVEYTFGMPVETYCTPLQHARLIGLQARITARPMLAELFPASDYPQKKED